MIVQERCEALRQRIAKGRERRQEHKGAEAYRHRATELHEMREGLARVIEKVEVLRNNGVPFPELPEAANAFVAMREYREALEVGETGGGRQYSRLTKAVESLRVGGRTQIGSALEVFERNGESPDDAILAVLQQFPGKQVEVARIRLEWRSIPSGKHLLSATAEELNSALERRRKIMLRLERLMGDIGVGEMPDDVRKFFKDLSDLRSVPFERMTPSVQQWLQQRGLLKHVRVSFGSG